MGSIRTLEQIRMIYIRVAVFICVSEVESDRIINIPDSESNIINVSAGQGTSATMGILQAGLDVDLICCVVVDVSFLLMACVPNFVLSTAVFPFIFTSFTSAITSLSTFSLFGVNPLVSKSLVLFRLHFLRKDVSASENEKMVNIFVFVYCLVIL
jgi:hypothetical protein